VPASAMAAAWMMGMKVEWGRKRARIPASSLALIVRILSSQLCRLRLACLRSCSGLATCRCPTPTELVDTQ
jgi:hypothetical protein